MGFAFSNIAQILLNDRFPTGSLLWCQVVLKGGNICFFQCVNKSSHLFSHYFHPQKYTIFPISHLMNLFSLTLHLKIQTNYVTKPTKRTKLQKGSSGYTTVCRRKAASWQAFPKL